MREGTITHLTPATARLPLRELLERQAPCLPFSFHRPSQGLSPGSVTT